MKKLSERAVVQYLSISAIAWPLHVLRGLYGSAVVAITAPAMTPPVAVVEARYRLFTCT